MAIFIVLGGLMGAAGVALAAAAAHSQSAVRLEPAGYLLILHAAALVSGVAALERALLWRPLGIVALAGFVAGPSLFAADLSLRAFMGQRLFPLAAPSGGAIAIAAWVILAVAALAAMFRA